MGIIEHLTQWFPTVLVRIVLALVGDHVAVLSEDGTRLVVWHAQTFEVQELRLEIATEASEVRLFANQLVFPMQAVELQLELPLRLCPLKAWLPCCQIPGNLSWYAFAQDGAIVSVERLSQLVVAIHFCTRNCHYFKHDEHFATQPVVASRLHSELDLLIVERSGACWRVSPASGKTPLPGIFSLDQPFRSSEALEGLCVAAADHVAVMDFSTQQWKISTIKAPLPDSVALLGPRVLGHYEGALVELVGDTWTWRARGTCGHSRLAFPVDVDLGLLSP